jgi:Uma2 family endonuclease
MMSAPLRKHQGISGQLFKQLIIFLTGHPCKVYYAPFDVRLFGRGDNDDTVVQPDITVVCDKSKLDEKGCNGAPDMIIEILSPSTLRHDTVRKFNKYLQAGVREYWIVDPESKTVSVHILENGQYATKEYADTDTISVYILKGCQINIQDVFEE